MPGLRKIAFNTSILYFKTIITLIISLVSVPIIIRALGILDYGIFSLIAGILTLLAFLNAAMTVSSLRYMSISLGNNHGNIQNTFKVSLLLHLIIGLFIMILFVLAGYYIFDNFLNIPVNKVEASKIVYRLLIVSTFFTIVSVPIDAIMNAYEDFMAISIIGILESILKLVLALSLTFIVSEKLIFYSAGFAFVTLVVIVSKLIFSLSKYKLKILNWEIDYSLLKEMASFAGWNTVGAISLVARNQGIAIILNLSFGALINASYGIANQVNNLLSYFSTSVQSAINPQLMQSEGSNNRNRMLNYALASSKYSTILLSFIAIPLIIEMPIILKYWINQVPSYTVEFCRLVICLALVSQYSAGIMSAIQSVGKIKIYTSVMSTILICNLPLSFLLLKFGYAPYFVYLIAITLEIIALNVRLIFAHRLASLSIVKFYKEVIFLTLFPISLTYIITYLITFNLISSLLNVFYTSIISTILLVLLYLKLSFSDEERLNLISAIKRFK